MPSIPQLSFREGPRETLQLCVRRPEGERAASADWSSELLSESPKGALFETLLALPPTGLSQLVQSVLGQIGALVTKPLSVKGNEVRVEVDDGFFFSAEEAATAACAALGLEIDPTKADPRIAKDPWVVEVGDKRLRFVLPTNRTPSLLALARQAKSGSLTQTDVVAAGEADLEDTAGKMAIRGRGLSVHCRDFGEDFLKRLEGYDSSKQILVTGAGTSRLARDLYFGCDRIVPSVSSVRLYQLTARPNEDKPKIVAVDLAEPPADVTHPNFRAETGLYARLPREQLLGGGPLFSDVIDMMGCLTYSPTLSEDLQKSLDLLEEGGKLWVGTSDSVVIYEDDKLLFLSEWMSQIDGLEVDCSPLAPSNGHYFQFSVTKAKKDVTVPNLTLLHRENRYPRAVSTVQIFEAEGA